MRRQHFLRKHASAAATRCAGCPCYHRGGPRITWGFRAGGYSQRLEVPVIICYATIASIVWYLLNHRLNICVCFSREEVAAVYNTPLLDLVYKAASVHRMYNDPQMVRNRHTRPHSLLSCLPAKSCWTYGLQVQRCTLLSIKTGGCPETCNYCAQSSSWSKDVGLKAEKLMDLDSVYEVC